MLKHVDTNWLFEGEDNVSQDLPHGPSNHGWIESVGPLVTKPKRNGFGTLLLRDD
jgi:hypothetical protein